jgi:REP element-mobilizing transposase RayT
VSDATLNGVGRQSVPSRGSVGLGCQHSPMSVVSQYRHAVASGWDEAILNGDLLTVFISSAKMRRTISVSSSSSCGTTPKYLSPISFRTYGTWLHGDKRGSIDRFHNQYGSPYIPPNETWRRHNQKQLKTTPLILGARERQTVEAAIRETCQIRRWSLLAFNVRTNHVHTVVSATRDPEVVLNAFKANATRMLREQRLWPHEFSPWVRKGSKRKLWNERSVARAIDYVLYGQGDDLPRFED